MGCHGGELVITFILSKINPIIQKQNNVGLIEMMAWVYWEICQDQILKERKKIVKIFKSFGLSINVTINVTSANYLDVNFDLTTDIHKLWWFVNFIYYLVFTDISIMVINRMISLFTLITFQPSPIIVQQISLLYTP